MPHPPFPAPRPARRGFTLIEIIVILIIIALMLVIIVPHLYNQWEMRKAERVKGDLVTLNDAIQHYALDNGKVGGAQLQYADLRKYLEPKSDVYLNEGRDLFGDSYGPFTVGTPPAVPRETADKLSAVAGDDFWSPFQLQ